MKVTKSFQINQCWIQSHCQHFITQIKCSLKIGNSIRMFVALDNLQEQAKQIKAMGREENQGSKKKISHTHTHIRNHQYSVEIIRIASNNELMSEQYLSDSDITFILKYKHTCVCTIFHNCYLFFSSLFPSLSYANKQNICFKDLDAHRFSSSSSFFPVRYITQFLNEDQLLSTRS